MELGFSPLEALVYCELVRRPGQTGYGVAQAIGKAPANAYQVLRSLSGRGALMFVGGETKVYHPVPPVELLERLQREHEARCTEAKALLDRTEKPAPEVQLYQLSTLDQVLERARLMLAAATDLILFDLFPRPLELLRGGLVDATARGVRVVGQIYEDGEVAGAATILSAETATSLQHWPGQQLTLVVDARQLLLALLDRRGTSVRHALWSDSVYMACVHHSGLAAEIRLNAMVREGAPGQAANAALLSALPPGLADMARMAADE